MYLHQAHFRDDWFLYSLGSVCQVLSENKETPYFVDSSNQKLNLFIPLCCILFVDAIKVSSEFVFSSNLLLCIYACPFLVLQSSQLYAFWCCVYCFLAHIVVRESKPRIIDFHIFQERQKNWIMFARSVQYWRKSDRSIFSSIQIHCCCCFELPIKISYHYEEFHSSYVDILSTFSW